MRVFVTRRGVRVPTFAAWFTASCVAVTLAAVPADAAPEAEKLEEVERSGDDSDGDGTPDRPDLVSAAATARVLKEPVEDLSQRRPSVQVLVNPDGTLTQNSFAAPVRVETAPGVWQGVDYTLTERSDGTVGPKVAPGRVAIGAGGDDRVASIEFGDGRGVEFTWPEPLPEPVLEGGVATFKVSETADLVVSVTAEGLATRVRLNERPASPEEAAVQLGLRATKVQVGETERGQLEFTTAGSDGKTIETSAALAAWDSQLDEAGDPVNVVAVEADVEKGRADGASRDHEVRLSAPAEWLMDPGTEYPVFIDPDIGAVTYGQDTWIRNGTTIVDTLPYRLMVGRIGSHSSTKAAHSFIQWDNAQLAGRKVLKADLHLFQYHSGSCSNKQMNIHPLDDVPWDEATTTWDDAPAGMTGTGTSVSPVLPQKGGTGCATNGWISTSIKAITQAWADGPSDGGFVNNGLTMNVPSAHASDVAFERRFCSKDFDVTHSTCNTADRVPYLSVTYNGPPGIPGAPSTPESRTFDGDLYAAGVRPVWSVTATDPEASQLTYELELRATTSGPVLGTCTTAQVASGGTAGCAPNVDLVDGQDYVLRSRAVDEHGLDGDWSGWTEFGSDQTAPGAVSITCTDYAADEWYDDNDPDETECTFTATGTADFEWRRTTAGTVEDRTALPATSGSATTPVIGVPANGVMRVEARAKSKSGLASAWTSYTFGVGTSVLTEPMRDDRSTSTFPVAASANEGATGAVIQWRYAPDDEGDTTTGWTDATQVKKAADGTAWNGSVSGTGISQTPRLMWTPVQESGVSAPSVLQVRVVFTYPGDVSMPSPMQQIQVIPHAFGSTFPTKQVGPAEVGLFSGELRYSATDVDIPGPDDSLMFARTHLSLAGETAGPAGVLGPGWIADFGNGQGAAGFVVLDRTATDGTLTLMSPNGESYNYAHSSGTTGALKTGTYEGIGETKQQKDKLELASGGGTGYSHTLTLTERSGVVTVFKRTTGGVWGTDKVTQPKDAGETTYVRDSAGLITWVFSPYVSGLTCNSTTQQRGCRALNFNYETVAGHKRLDSIELRTWDPKPGTDGKPTSANTMAWKLVAEFDYDSNGYLTHTWKPLAWNDSGTTPLKTGYEYDTAGGKTKLTKVTEPGLKPWRFAYDGNGRLETVKRERDAAAGGSGDATWTLAYDLPTSGGGLPDVRESAITSWGQLPADAPTTGAAVWGPNKEPGSTPSASDYEYAYLAYTTRSGRTVNAAEYGAGAWQIDSTRYDAHGNIVWQLGAAGRNRALAESTNPEVSAGLADKYAAFTLYNATGTRVENTYSPMRTVVLDNGDTVVARTTTATDYDDEADSSLMPGRPTSGVPDGGFDLPIEERVAVTDKLHPAATGNIWDSRATRYRYDKINSADADTWKLGLATRVLTENGTGWTTSLSRYDKYGYLIESRGPAGTAVTDGSANDVYSTKYVYYTANGDASESMCRNKPEWAGLICITKPGGNPSGGHPVPTEKTWGYTMMWSPTRVDQSGPTGYRANVTSFDYVDRVTSSRTTSQGTDTTVDLPAKDRTYSTTTGLPVSVAAGTAGTESFTYDTWGRLRTRTDSSGNTATTTYDAAGRVGSFADGKGTYTYGYDGTDSRGKAERRGKVTSIDVGLASGPDEVTGAYDANGELIEQQLPGGVSATWLRDVTGVAYGLWYKDGPDLLMAFAQTYDHFGRVHSAHGPDSTQIYGYDARDRLVKVQDTYQGSCFTRTYGFDASSNRTSLANHAPDTGGACQDATPLTTETASFDTGDRITTSGYAYDELGRTTAVPAAHTDQPSGSALSVAYHANDMVRSLTQTIPDDDAGTVAVKQEFTLDALDRISTTKGYTAGVQTSESTNAYASESDGPAWVESKTRPNASTAWTTTWTRNVSTLAGGLGILQPNTGDARLQLADLRGNIVASSTIGGTGLDSYTSYTEYGTAREGVPDDYQGYGWLGAHARKSGNVGGLTLMGARLYNPDTGRFLSRDPVPGGNDNAYVYPPDPINKLDLSGRAWWDLLVQIVRIIVKVESINQHKNMDRHRAFGGRFPSHSSKPKPKPKPQPKPKKVFGLNLGLSGCAVVCGGASVNFSRGVSVNLEFGFGPSFGGGVNAGLSYGPAGGTGLERFTCSGKLGPFGGYGAVESGEDYGIEGWEIGWAGGAGGGCHASATGKL